MLLGQNRNNSTKTRFSIQATKITFIMCKPVHEDTAV